MVDKKLEDMLNTVSPGTPLREGLTNILEAGLGALMVVGYDKVIEDMMDGGFLLDCEFTPEKIYELAKMDGAIILDNKCEKIISANVHLQADRNYYSNESGTRHRTAQRVAEQSDNLVIAISERRKVITLYKGKIKYRLKEIVAIESEAAQAIKTMERYKLVLDKALSNLTILELDNAVTMYEVSLTFQKFEMLKRIAQEIKAYISELGVEGRLLNLQFQNLNQDIECEELNFIEDYLPKDMEFKEVVEKIEKLDDKELMELENFSAALGYGKTYATLDKEVTPRGYRLLGRIGRLTKKDIEKLISQYKNISEMQNADPNELSNMKLSKTKIKALKNGLQRLKFMIELEKDS